MKVLITNDDGVHSQGIIQLAKLVRTHCEEVFVVAPRIEQSGVSQAITFLSPLFPHALGGDLDSQDDHIPGYSVNGTPVDCVKLGIHELCPWKPDLVLSGINGGLNAGINVGHSGTAGAALAAATFGIPAFALSLESSESMDFGQAAELIWPLIKNVMQIGLPARTVVNVNIPSVVLDQYPETVPEVVMVPVETNPMAYDFDTGTDPKGRPYFWSTNFPVPEASEFLTDTQALAAGKVTISTISYDLNQPTSLDILKSAMGENYPTD
ncbi:5'/3'-nucleotidase SurE [Mariniblastus sp.]|nr:5'/3'-nucleotidase SurE [Mariniblastus sp.]MDA7925554.1 5'/3'-nucleotidase SurE [Mariniblastus sp.]MDB4380724.1 5'/3'-nucleotidase SurE [Mariniblastus sp.]MDB4468276.1 5'/3'-nucleotidase SurE [bacterium]